MTPSALTRRRSACLLLASLVVLPEVAPRGARAVVYPARTP